MKNPHEVQMGTRIAVIATLLLLALVALGTLAWQAYHTAHGACQSEAHLADLCGSSPKQRGSYDTWPIH